MPILKSKPTAEPATGAAAAAADAQPTTDDQGRRVGLEDPNDPALVDDPTIFASGIPTVKYPPVSGAPSTSLIDGAGKPFIDPKLYGGQLLNQSAGLGEPLNVIISALSSPEILQRKGLQGYLRSLDFDMECFGLHSGNAQRAWLDPRGWVDENFLYREVYTSLDHLFGTCIESLAGGNHIRAWQQQGTGAWFFAASSEMNVSKHHMIIPDGYNIGRDELVKQSQKKPQGETSFMFKRYQTTVQYVEGLINPGTEGVNHGIATDGRVALLTVKLLGTDDKARLKQVNKERKEAEKAHYEISKKYAKAAAEVTPQAGEAVPTAPKSVVPNAAQRVIRRLSRAPAPAAAP